MRRLVTRNKRGRPFRLRSLWVRESPVVEVAAQLIDKSVQLVLNNLTGGSSSANASLIVDTRVSVGRRNNVDNGRVEDIVEKINPLSAQMTDNVGSIVEELVHIVDGTAEVENLVSVSC